MPCAAFATYVSQTTYCGVCPSETSCTDTGGSARDPYRTGTSTTCCVSGCDGCCQCCQLQPTSATYIPLFFPTTTQSSEFAVKSYVTRYACFGDWPSHAYDVESSRSNVSARPSYTAAVGDVGVSRTLVSRRRRGISTGIRSVRQRGFGGASADKNESTADSDTVERAADCHASSKMVLSSPERRYRCSHCERSATRLRTARASGVKGNRPSAVSESRITSTRSV